MALADNSNPVRRVPKNSLNILMQQGVQAFFKVYKSKILPLCLFPFSEMFFLQKGYKLNVPV